MTRYTDISMLCLVACISHLSAAPPPVTIASLVHEMSDRDSLARTPAPAFKQLQASSYDRAETDPKNPKTWFANQDYGQFIRTEPHDGRTEWVVMEHHGPGAITRIWTPLLADKNKMIVRFYFDGAVTPTIEEPFNDMMRGNGPFKSPFAFVSWPEPDVNEGVGSDFYFPIPFAKGCKVTMSEVPFYYSIDYRAYPPGTRVETFNWAAFNGFADAAATAGRELAAVAPCPDDDPGRRAPGQDLRVDAPSGPAAISEIQVAVPKDIDSQTLRSSILEINFDGEPTVWCPIGDFFGCGIHLRPIWDRYRSVTADGVMTSRWTMPYRRSASVRLIGPGSSGLRANLIVRTKPWDWDRRSMHFHASWRHQYPLNTRPMSDWNYLEASGNGIYAGDTLTVMSPSAAWYGEGDERVYVDGESFPSQLGTGTEDYYGYAWGMAEHFSSPFIAMPARDRKGRDNWMGFTTTSRVRGLDAIPFEHSFKFDMEIWDWADCQVEYSAATFWYARPGATSNRPAVPAEAAKPLPEVGGSVKGAIECESMEVASKSPDVQVSTQTGALTQGTWSADQQLFLQAHAIGDFVELRVPLTSAGRRRVLLYATKSYDYGIVRISIDGKVAKQIDLWNAKPVASGPIDLGVFELQGKEALLRVQVVGCNPLSKGDRYYFGLDCLVLEPLR